LSGSESESESDDEPEALTSSYVWTQRYTRAASGRRDLPTGIYPSHMERYVLTSGYTLNEMRR